MDVVSGGEYLRATAAGVPASGSCFPASARPAEEMRLALEGGIRQFNVESEPELEALSRGRVLHGQDRADHRCA
jgi:diaminopimelate decarboxylase